VSSRWLTGARIAFLVLALGFAWWGLRDQWPAILEAIAALPWWRILAAQVLVLAGLLLTAGIWRTVVRGYGHELPDRPARSIFFVGQLGKYIPGGVWSLGAQAAMATRYAVPPRVTVAVGLVFLGLHVLTAAPVAVLVLPDLDAPPVTVALLGAGLLALAASPVVDRAGTWAAGAPLRLGSAVRIRVLLVMLVVWAAYGAASTLLVPPTSTTAAGGGPGTAVLVTGAVAAAYLVGVVVVIAPAGVGAREATLGLLLAPTLGVPAAAAVALLSRLVHTVGDLLLAGIAWWLARGDARSDV
jgi:uncharacterized membrane protein YbhN (UPF0104 family)